MPGVLKLEGTNIATGDGNGAVTINNATLGSAVTVPASVGGTEVLLEKYTANDSVTNKIFDLSTFSETFNEYKLVLNKLIPTNDNCDINGRLGTATGSIQTTNYRMCRWHTYFSGTDQAGNSSLYSTDRFFLHTALGNATGEGLSGEMFIFSPRNALTNTTTSCQTVGVYYDNSFEYQVCGSLNMKAQDDKAIQIYAESSSNLKSGTITLYGIRDA